MKQTATVKKLIECISGSTSEQAIEKFLAPQRGRKNKEKTIKELEEFIEKLNGQGYDNIIGVAKEINKRLSENDIIVPPQFKTTTVQITPPQYKNSYKVPPPPASFLPKDYRERQEKLQQQEDDVENIITDIEQINGFYYITKGDKVYKFSNLQINFFHDIANLYRKEKFVMKDNKFVFVNKYGKNMDFTKKQIKLFVEVSDYLHIFRGNGEHS